MDEHDEQLRAAWSSVRLRLERLTATVDSGQAGHVDLMRFADDYAALSREYLVALRLQGKSSMRVESAVKALDLKTPKSALERFLGRRPD